MIEGLRLKATFVLVIYFFSEENNSARDRLEKRRLGRLAESCI